MITLDEIELPADMEWPDRFTGWKVGQDIQTSVEGSLIVQQSARQAGRPITLKSIVGERMGDGAVVDFATVQALQAKVDAGESMTLTIPTYDSAPEIFTVMFDQSSPIEARPWDWWRAKPAAGDRWSITLKFIVVE
jgi:hypothetical protein